MQAANSYRVLLVEDEGLIARDIANRLESLGHRVIDIASTGEEATEMAAGADVVLMDIRLDGPMDGIEAARRIRQRHHLPVIFLTAHADRATIQRAKQAEPFGYIVKPVAPAALQTSLEIAVHKNAIERELAEREAWLRAVLVSVADAVAVAGVDGRVRILNPAAEALTGWTEAEAKGRELTKVVPLVTEGVASGEGPVPLAMLRDGAVSLDRDARLQTRGGRSVPVEGSAAPVRLDGTAIGAVLSFRDVSHRLWEEQQFQQAQKVETAARLAAGVAGEYTTLLTAIRGQAERLLDSFGDYSPARQSAEEIRQAVAAAEQITRRLAGFGRRQPTHLEVLSPNGVLRRMTKLLETVAGTDVNVIVRPGLLAGKVKADEGQMEQLLMNLTMHAAQWCTGGGEILIETQAAEGVAEGVPGAYLRIAVTHPLGTTAPDPQMDPAAEDESLALSVVHNIVRGHGGFLTARRTGAATGCLEVLLPRWMETEALPAATPNTSTHTVLLVEAREVVRAEIHKFFEANGFNLLEASDAGEAIALGEVREGPLDVVIAPASEADRIEEALRSSQQQLILLRIVESEEHSAGELRQSYTQNALLERVSAALANREESAAGETETVKSKMAAS